MLELYKRYIDDYYVSNLGNVKHNNVIMKGSIDKNGYKVVKIKGRKFKVHRLVAILFIKNDQNKKQVNHIDGNKLNNKTNNLEWCTAKENVMHSYKMGLNKGKKGKKVKCIEISTGKEKVFDSIRECAKWIKVNEVTVHNCISGKIKTVNKKRYKVLEVM